MTRRLRAPGLLLALLLGVTTACTGGSSDGTGPEAPSGTTASTTSPDPSAPADPAPSDDLRPPVTAATAAADWPGADTDFLAALGPALSAAGVEAVGSDPESVALGRDFCSVVSGGGLVADKVAFWSNQYGLDQPTVDAIAGAAGTTYCTDAYAAYRPVRDAEEPGAATAPERADLFRFIVRRTAEDPSAVGDVTDARIRQRGADFCARLRAPGADLSQLASLDPDKPDERLAAAYAVGLGLSYCPAVFARLTNRP